jgi:arginine metabolism regulation protein II
MQNVHAHLGDSEALIRKEGLPKPVKSQKISKLHHIFSFLRIIHESTSLRGRQSVNDHDLNELQSLVTQDNAETSGSRLAWVNEDEPEDTEEDPLFVSIYQLPTTLLSLLSQTSSLCKQLHSPEASSPAFARRCQIIEDRIFKWKAPENLALPNYEVVEAPDLSTGPGREIAAHLVNAT